MIAGPLGLPVPVGSIEIKTDPMLVEDWILQKVASTAVKQLTKYVVNSNYGKAIN